MSIRIITDHPIAVEYAEHFDRDSDHSLCISRFTNQNFNQKLYKLFSGKTLRVVDLGCSVGAFVADCLWDGHIAVGIEGTDWYVKHVGLTKQWPTDPTVCIRDKVFNVDEYSEWGRYPENFFTADITKPFQLVEGEDKVEFDAVTAWEVMEHISEADLPQLLTNIKGLLAPEGLFICSISKQRGAFHKTVKNEKWWDGLFARYNFVLRPDLVDMFGEDWVRGPKQAAPDSFHRIIQIAQ